MQILMLPVIAPFLHPSLNTFPIFFAPVDEIVSEKTFSVSEGKKVISERMNYTFGRDRKFFRLSSHLKDL